MVVTQRTGTLMRVSRLSKLAMRAVPESAMGMSMRHYMALYCVAADGVPQRELAEQLCIDANNTVILLNQREDLGWVTRERDPSDRRRHLVRVTDSGREAVARAQAARDLVEDEVLGALDEGERRRLDELVTKALGE